MKWRLMVVALALFIGTGGVLTLRPRPEPDKPAAEIDPALGTLAFFGSMPGLPTLDRGRSPGNPFATAFLGSLDAASLGEFSAMLASVTPRESNGFQEVDVPLLADDLRAQQGFASDEETRLALILAVSTTKSPTLPGAKFDAE